LGLLTIAIDGPAASGKSTVGGIVAQRLHYVYFDTGVMYRAITWAALDRGIAITDQPAVTRLAEQLRIEVLTPTADDGRQYTILADGVDITWAIRGAEVNQQVSPVSAYPGVRAALTAQQRRIGAPGGVVMVGRDIGTVVLPEAQVKVYLDATVEERAQRRFREERAQGVASSLEQVLAILKKRDGIDSSRETAPLTVAADATVIDSTDMGIEEVVQAVLCLADRARKG
jgi:cytidylate kinase